MSSRIKSGEGQTVLLGLVFMFVFMAYYMIQGYCANLYGPTLASNMETTLYAVFTLSCFPAPAVTNKLGPRLSMFLGILGYAALVGASLLFYLGIAGGWVVVAGGAVNGVGAALLWTAQGRLMLEYASEASQGRGEGADSKGRVFAIFWGIFNVSAVLGGLVTYAYFRSRPWRRPKADPSSEESKGNVPLFVIFLGLIVTGGAGVLALSPPKQLHAGSPPTSTHGPPHGPLVHQRSDKGSEKGQTLMSARDPAAWEGSLGDPFGDPLGSSHEEEAHCAAEGPGSPGRSRAEAGEGGGSLSWASEMVSTVALFRDPHMARLTLLFWYTGFNQPYQLVTFGNRFFEPSTLGLMLANFYAFEIIGAVLSSHLLSDSKERAPGLDSPGAAAATLPLVPTSAQRSGQKSSAKRSGEGPGNAGCGGDERAKARRGLAALAALTLMGGACAAALEVTVEAADKASVDSVFRLSVGGAAMSLWGASDALAQGLAYWMIGTRYTDGPAQARGVGFYKVVQSAGWCAGFALCPAHRLRPTLQLAATVGCALLGLAVLELPPQSQSSQRHGGGAGPRRHLPGVN